MPPCTTKRRTATNLKTKNNQNCQKIKLYRSPTTKDLKNKHSSRLIGVVEMGRWSREDWWRGLAARQWLEDQLGEAVAGGPGGPTFVCR